MGRKLEWLTIKICRTRITIQHQIDFCIKHKLNISSSWEDTKDPAACNTNRNVYMNFSRDPERTPYQWDDTKNAGFSQAETTWLPVNPNYVDLNLKHERDLAKSHYKFYHQLAHLRNHDTFKFGDFKTQALNKNVFAFTRDLLDSDTFVTLINLGSNNEHVNLKVFATLRNKLEVVAASSSSDYEEG